MAIRPSYVNKIPPAYVDRTIGRLLPSNEEIQKLSPDQLLALAKRVEELKVLIKNDPVRFYQPNPGGQWDFMTLDDSTVRVLLFIAGNKTGKTTGGAIKMAEYMTGRLLWGHDFRQPTKFKVPSYGCVFAEDFDSHKEVTLPAYLSWCPKRDIKSVVKNPAGNVVHIEHTNGSMLFFRTYDQGSDKAEGKDWDVVWCDEPPPRPVYTAVLRGLVTLNGLFLITATLLKETWLFDEADDKIFIRKFLSSIYDNPWLSDSARSDFIASLSDEERDVRVDGKPISLTGLVYKEFVDAPPYIIPDQEFPNDWPIIMGVDPHERKPIHILWSVMTPTSGLVVFDWALIKGSIEEIHQQILIKEKSHTMPAVLCVMDPNRGRAKQIDEKSWEQTFEDYGYPVLLGIDDIRIGHTAVHSYFLAKDLAGKHSPVIRFTESCRGKGGPVHHLTRYAWSDWVRNRGNADKAVKEVPKDTFKDFPDIIRYMCLAELDFDTLKYGPKVINHSFLSDSYRLGMRSF